MAAQLLELTHHARHARVRNAFKEIPLSPLSFTFLPLPLLISDPIKSDLRMRMRKNGRQRERERERTSERARGKRKRTPRTGENGKECGWLGPAW